MGEALRREQPLPVPAISSKGVSMRLKAELAERRAALVGTTGLTRPAIHGQYAAQVCRRRVKAGFVMRLLHQCNPKLREWRLQACSRSNALWCCALGHPARL